MSNELIKVRFLADQYISEWGGRFRVGDELEVDPDTATRWERRDIAQRMGGGKVLKG